ncbi:glycerol-3-phosphate acyltransferase PlsY [Ardenticatena maritima]|uniref:Glycerol-3-phosphate acyltransferase n=1 Tax=Ardenticatena maritima TaxID=872965 RepID=A0A0M8KCC8_9CHLR|nr:hypothetical protein SE16_13570 [Ardenticatena maritima]GAP64666.1 glycerol-3-phosphate acyltransferase PlsY [Ardenticatena maritima]
MLVTLIIAILIGYLVGSIPNGVLIGRYLFGVDPRTVGSGRTGGTNVYRAAGPKAGILTAITDAFKGILAVLLVRMLITDNEMAAQLAGLFAVVGHNWSIFLKFKGGAGTMPNLGAMATLSATMFVPAGLLGLISLYVWRMASLASLVVAWTGLLAALLFAREYWLYAIGQALVVTWALRPNIKRILNGTERRIGERNKTPVN